MISRLSDLLRLTFDRSGAPRVSLQEELEFLQKYLEIEQTRFHDRLSVKFDIDPETLDAEVPRLILQPLASKGLVVGDENAHLAVRHATWNAASLGGVGA